MRKFGPTLIGTVLLCMAIDLTATQESVDSLRSWTESALQYLAIYHRDYTRIEIEERMDGTVTEILLMEPNGRSLLRLPVDASAETHFRNLCGLIFRNSHPRMSQSTSNALQTAWFLDFLCRTNPSHLDRLAKQYDSASSERDFSRARLFWRYRALIKAHGGRELLGKCLWETPEAFNGFNPDNPVDASEMVAIYEIVDFESSPVLTVDQSARRIRQLARLPGTTKMTLLHSPSGLISRFPDMQPLARSRIQRVKALLRRINPLFLNALQSLGIVFESILSGDQPSVNHALQNFEKDWQCTEQVVQSIRRYEGTPIHRSGTRESHPSE